MDKNLQQRERRLRTQANIQAALQSLIAIPSSEQATPYGGVPLGPVRDPSTALATVRQRAPQSTPNPAISSLDPDLQWVIQHESGGRTTAKNPTSTAFGLGQLLKANRKSYGSRLGIQNPDTTDYNEQLKMMQLYIKERYGSAAEAKRFWQKHNWY